MGKKQENLGAPPSLVGDKIYLRPASPEDISNTHHWTVNSEPQSLSCRPLPMQTTAQVVELAKKSDVSPDRRKFVICRRKDRTPVGTTSFFDYNPLNRSAELGLMVDPEERKKGYGAAAIQLLTGYLFHYRGLNKVYAQTAAFNDGAIALLESLEFKKDATLRDHYYYKGEFHAGLIYSLLRFELPW